MRSKTPLALMEQAIMVLVFALAAVLCLRVFVWSDRTSELAEAKDMAALRAQSAAEIIKNEGRSGKSEAEVIKAAAGLLGGSFSDSTGSLTVGYSGDWKPYNDGENAEYILTVSPKDSGEEKLGAVHIDVRESSSGELLIELEAAWQKGES